MRILIGKHIATPQCLPNGITRGLNGGEGTKNNCPSEIAFCVFILAVLGSLTGRSIYNDNLLKNRQNNRNECVLRV